MFEYLLYLIAGLSLLTVITIIVIMVIDKIRHKKTSEKIRKWLLSFAIIFIGISFIAKAINDQKPSSSNKQGKTLTMQVLDSKQQNIKKSNHEFHVKSTNDKHTSFTVKTNRKAEISYNLIKNDKSKVTAKKIHDNEYQMSVRGNLKQPTIIYINAAIIGQRIGSNVTIN